MSRKSLALFGVASLTAALGACGDAGESNGVANGVSVPSGDLGTEALPPPDPDKVPPNPFEDDVRPSERYRRLATTIELERVKQGVPGIAVGVIENGKLTWSKGFGQKSAFDPGSGQVGATTMFRSPVLGIGLSRLLALNLADKGEIALNDGLDVYLPDLKLTYDPHGWFGRIAIRHLLTWSSGLPRTQERWYQLTPRDVGLLQWSQSKMFSDMYVDFDPGRLVAGHSYAEPRLLALVAEQVTGQAFRKLVDERLLGPLGMRKTVYLSSDVDDRSIAVGASPFAAQDAATAAPVWGPYTNIDDMAKYVQFFLRGNEAILSDNFRELAMYKVVRIDNFEDACGEAFVWHVQNPRCADNTVPDPIVSMDSGVGGFKSAIYMDPAKNFGLVILSNADAWNAMPVVKEAFKLANIAAPTWNNKAPDVFDLAKFEGKYLTAAPWANRWIEVKHVKTSTLVRGMRTLYMQWHDGDILRTCMLRPTSPNAFRCEALDTPEIGFDGPPAFPTIVAPTPGWNVGDKYIPLGPPASVYGFDVRFEFDANDKVEYIVSAPFVGHRFRYSFPDIELPLP